MNSFSCPICDKIFSKKHHLDAHGRRKNPCGPLTNFTNFTSQTPSQTTSQLLTFPHKLPHNPQNHLTNYLITSQTPSQTTSQTPSQPHKLPHNPHKLPHNPHNPLKSDTDDQDHNIKKPNSIKEDIMVLNMTPLKKPYKKRAVKQIHMCEICAQVFSRKDNLTRHKKLFCKGKNDEEFVLDLSKLENNKGIEGKERKEKINVLEEIEKIENKEIKQGLDNKNPNPIQMQMITTNTNRQDNKKKYDVEELIKGYEVDDKTKLILSVLIKQNQELKDEIKNIKQSTINNTLNNQNNIIIAHGSEQFDKIELETIMNHLSTVNFKDIIPNMTKHLYINDKNPQFKNFCVVDLARNKCKYHDGKRWVVANTNEKIDKIFDNVHNVLMEPFEKDKIEKTIKFIKENPRKFCEKWITYSRNYLTNLYDEEDRENMENKNKIINELKLIFFNHKDEILKIEL